MVFNEDEYWIINAKNGKTVARRKEGIGSGWLSCRGSVCTYDDYSVKPIRKLTDQERVDWFDNEDRLLKRAILHILSA